jgi:hypothetical protein
LIQEEKEQKTPKPAIRKILKKIPVLKLLSLGEKDEKTVVD